LKTVLITGCSSGMGAAVSKALANRGHRVFATVRNPSSTLKAAEAKMGEISFHTLDVCNEDSIMRLRNEILELTNGAGPEVLINNAGIGAIGPTEMMPMPAARACLETNVLGLMAVTQAFLPMMRERRRGHIINVASLVGRIAMPYEGIYVASKHAVEGLSDVLRFEMAPFGIDVTIIEPGPVRTEFERHGVDQLAAISLQGSPYQDHVKGFLGERGKAFKSAPSAEKAAGYFVRIVEAKRPPARFLFPGQTRLLKFAFGTMPDRLTDALKRVVFKVPRHAVAETNP
jgi:NAD(P)-dependent dehydrogenase (short-subunit alcohol dehydrogenase family)